MVGISKVISTADENIQLDYPWQPWVVVLSAALFFFFEFIQMNMFNAINPSLIAAFKVTATQLGNLSAMYFYGNVSFLFVAGLLLDRFSTRRLLLTAVSICVIGTYLFAMSTHLWQAEACRFVTGIASTFCMLTAVRLASRWFPPRRIALVIGLVLTMAMAGGMLAQTPLTYLTRLLGWRHAVMLNASLGIFVTAAIFLWVKDFPRGAEKTRAREKAHLKALGFVRSITLALRNKQNWLAGFYANFLSFPVVILGASWGSLYLMHVRHLTHLQTSYVTSMIFFGMIFGAPMLGWLSDTIAYRKMPMIVGAFLTFILIMLIMYLPGLHIPSLMALFFVLGFLAGIQVLAYPVVVESNSRTITNTAEGLACTIIMSAGLFQFVYGLLLDANWNGVMSHGLRVYSASDYQWAAIIFPVSFLVAGVLAFFLKETRGQLISASEIKQNP